MWLLSHAIILIFKTVCLNEIYQKDTSFVVCLSAVGVVHVFTKIYIHVWRVNGKTVTLWSHQIGYQWKLWLWSLGSAGGEPGVFVRNKFTINISKRIFFIENLFKHMSPYHKYSCEISASNKHESKAGTGDWLTSECAGLCCTQLSAIYVMK